MQLSTSTLNAFYDCPKSYMNKQMYLPKVDFEYFHYGTEGHKIIQEHVSMKKTDDRLIGKIEYLFPIVEEEDFDPRLKFNLEFGENNFIGFLDARNDVDKVFSDIKISTSLWTLKKFLTLMQRKVYSLAYPGYSFVGITATPDLSEVYCITLPFRQKDADEALNWIMKGFQDVKNSDFKPNPKANCHRCVYKESCEDSKCKG